MKKKKANNFEVDTPLNDERCLITYDDSSRTHCVYITDTIEGPEEYNNVFNLLLNAKEEETIKIILSTPGGRLDTVNLIRGLILLTQAKVIAVIGDVASGGTIIPLACDDIIVMPNIEFMIHNYSGGAYGKGHEIYAHVRFLEQNAPAMFNDYYKDFLTPEEISEVVSGQDKYLNSEQVVERWDRVLLKREEYEANRQQAELQALDAEQIEALIQCLTDKGYSVKKTTKIRVSNDD